MPERLANRLPPALVEIAIGLATALAATAARLPLEPLLGQRAPYALVFLGVVVACVLGGWRSGLIALVTGQLLTLFTVVDPRWSFSGLDSQGLGGFLFSSTSQLLILAVVALYQREVARALGTQERQMDLLSEALREIDHRTKNNYQTVVALIALQAKQAHAPEVRQALQEAADRVHAVSLASDKLALRSENLGTVRLGDHICDLCEQIKRGLSSEQIKVECDVANFATSTEKAIYISIIVNELVTNTLKHAFREAAEGIIRVSSKVDQEGVAIIVVEDNGSGMAPASSGARTGLGTRLVERFVRQIDARHLVTSSASGTVHNILIPSLA